MYHNNKLPPIELSHLLIDQQEPILYFLLLSPFYIMNEILFIDNIASIIHVIY
jgi:hypothetical protein